jgi:hypothetical protein
VIYELWRRKIFFNGTRNLDCAARSNIAYATPAISIAEYFHTFYKEAKMKLKNGDKAYEFSPMTTVPSKYLRN